jgi:ubiquinone biosynthesis protein UbiJ
VIGPTAQSAAVAALETLINRALMLDPASRARLAALAGQVFHIECTRPALQLFVLPQRDRVQLAARWEGVVSAGLSGSAEDFIELLTSADPATTLINGNLNARGDSRALQRLQAIAGDLDIDWEAPLTRLFGDIVGHQLGRGLRRVHTLFAQAGRSLGRQLRDYVREESDWLAPRWQVETFCAEVVELARRGDRLELRATQLRQQLARRQQPAAR